MKFTFQISTALFHTCRMSLTSLIMMFNLIIAMFILESILFFKLMRLALKKKASLALMTMIRRLIIFVDLIVLESNMIFIFRGSLESLLGKVENISLLEVLDWLKDNETALDCPNLNLVADVFALGVSLFQILF